VTRPPHDHDRSRHDLSVDALLVLRLLAAVEIDVPATLLHSAGSLDGVDADIGLAELRRKGLTHTIDDHVVRISLAGSLHDAASMDTVVRARLRGSLGRAAHEQRALRADVVARLLIDGLIADPDPAVISQLLDAVDDLLLDGVLDDSAAVLVVITDALDRGQPATPEVRLRANMRLSFVWRCLGRPDDAERLAMKASALARRSTDPTAIAIAALAWRPESAINASDDPTAVALLDDALVVIGDSDLRLRALLLSARADALLFIDLAEARRAATEALMLARSSGDSEAFIKSAYSYRLAHWHPSRQDEMLALGTEMVATVPQPIDCSEFGALTRLQVLLELGRFAAFDDELAALWERIDRHGLPYERMWAHAMSAARSQTRGDWADADSHIGAALALGRGDEYPAAHQLLVTQQLIAAWQRGHDLSALDDVVLPAGPLRASWEANLLGWRSAAMSPSALAAGLDRLLADGMRSVRDDLTVGPVTASLAVATVAASSTTHARLLFDEMSAWSGQWAGTGGAVCYGPYDMHLGALAALLGDRTDAVRLLQRALASCVESGCRPWQARAHLALANAFDDAVEREHHAHAARTLADQLGMAIVAQDARQVLQPTSAGSGLSEAELDVLRLVVDGKTNRQLATELHVSVKTVERRLLNAYRKIGARNRAEATAFAVRHLGR
jgi:DNA-binding CsgD family transcriptional regulator